MRCLDAFGGLKVTAQAIAARQGGNAANWQSGGTTNYVPGPRARIQLGSISDVWGGVAFQDVTITLPVAYSQTPWVVGSLVGESGIGRLLHISCIAISASQIRFTVSTIDGSAQTGVVYLSWMAAGEIP